MDVRPYRWDLVPRVRRRELRLLAALAGAWPRPVRSEPPPEGLAPLSASVGPVRAYRGADLQARLADPTAFALRLVRADGDGGFAVVPGPFGAAVARRLLGGRPRELAAPRAATRAEQGVCAMVAAALLDRYGVDAIAVQPHYEPSPALPAALGDGWALGVDVTVAAAGQQAVVFAVAPERAVVAPPTPRDPAALLRRGGHWLSGARWRAPVVSGVGRIGLRDLLALARRDVLLLDQPPDPQRGRLAVGRGGFPVNVTDTGVEIAGPYDRGEPMEDTVADDVTVHVSCQLGTVELSARQVLELSPGQVLPLARPLGGPVDLVVGTRVIGTGELVDVDGELGVRVLSLREPPPTET
ncbi:MAG: hypothetical protein D6689_13295 [Deltaproteobacteria bacterium]|nr:MAG: hypothetical protein D6689_13295 [Deltaproteobacteria bacterium]